MADKKFHSGCWEGAEKAVGRGLRGLYAVPVGLIMLSCVTPFAGRDAICGSVVEEELSKQPRG